YQNDVIPVVCELLGLNTKMNDNFDKKNTSLSAATTELLRVINQYPLNVQDKADSVFILQKLDSILASYSKTIAYDEKAKIFTFSSLGINVLKSDYNILLG
ncbi:hypothetical protein QUF50_10345, partial [Thiotrichales bacterium HSG1]|nr:hypothetical protein [Thiotrichales bacterium HSG1]